MNEIISFIFTLIPWGIKLAIVGGIVFCGIAVCGIRKENMILEDSFIHGHLRKRDLEHIRKNISEGESQHSQVSHLWLRLSALLEAINLDAKTVETTTPVLPKLEDLHELTLRNEQSRISTTAMTTIVSFLLILGIFGTITGVHNTIQEDGINQALLGKALEPSMWAVGGTILLIMAKGYYLRKVDRYVARLDALTMSHILPALQEQRAQENIHMKMFADKVKEQAPQVQHIQELIKEGKETNLLENINLISESIMYAKKMLTERKEAMVSLQQKLTLAKRGIEK